MGGSFIKIIGSTHSAPPIKGTSPPGTGSTTHICETLSRKTTGNPSDTDLDPPPFPLVALAGTRGGGEGDPKPTHAFEIKIKATGVVEPTEDEEDYAKEKIQEKVKEQMSGHTQRSGSGSQSPPMPQLERQDDPEEESAAVHSMQAPLEPVPGGGELYKPLKLSDLKGLTQSLPPLSEGANLWLNKLYQLKANQTLALGDLRGIMRLVMTGTDFRSMQEENNLTGLPDSLPLSDYIGNIAGWLREKYPGTHASKVPKYMWKPEVPPIEYLS